MNGILRAIVIQAMLASHTRIVIHHGRPTRGMETFFDIGQSVFREIQSHTTARTAEAYLQEGIHLPVLKTPDKLFDLNPQRLAREPQFGSSIHTREGLFRCKLDRHAVVDNHLSAHIQKQTGQIVRIIFAVVTGAAQTFLHAADVFRLRNGALDQIHGHSNALHRVGRNSFANGNGDALCAFPDNALALHAIAGARMTRRMTAQIGRHQLASRSAMRIAVLHGFGHHFMQLGLHMWPQAFKTVL